MSHLVRRVQIRSSDFNVRGVTREADPSSCPEGIVVVRAHDVGYKAYVASELSSKTDLLVGPAAQYLTVWVI